MSSKGKAPFHPPINKSSSNPKSSSQTTFKQIFPENDEDILFDVINDLILMFLGVNRSIYKEQFLRDRRKKEESMPGLHRLWEFSKEDGLNIDLKTYLMTIHQECKFKLEVYVIMLVYFDMISQNVNRLSGDDAKHEKSGKLQDIMDQKFVITEGNVHSLILAAIAIASKAMFDDKYNESALAKAGSISHQSLIELQIAFMYLLDFNLIVSREDLLRFAQNLATLKKPSVSYSHSPENETLPSKKQANGNKEKQQIRLPSIILKRRIASK